MGACKQSVHDETRRRDAGRTEVTGSNTAIFRSFSSPPPVLRLLGSAIITIFSSKTTHTIRAGVYTFTSMAFHCVVRLIVFRALSHFRDAAHRFLNILLQHHRRYRSVVRAHPQGGGAGSTLGEVQKNREIQRGSRTVDEQDG